jgi:phosphate transport system permease protein
VAVRIPVRNAGEKLIHYALFSCALVSVCITFSIVLSVLVESLHFFKQVNLWQFLTGTHWSPQATHDGQKNLSDAFGAIPLFTGTFLIMVIAIGIAAPVGLLCAIYLAEYANPTFRNFAKPILEILAGIPTVVYGYFAIITIAPLLRQAGEHIGISIASESALAAGFVMGIMIIPFISSLADDIIVAVPRALRDASYGLGATQSETIKHVVLPAAIPGIMGALLLAISRAVGETMIVVMAAGLSANLTFNPLNAVTTVTAQIVALLGGDQEFDSAKTLAAFALGLTLFVATLILNIIALIIVKKYREQYE